MLNIVDYLALLGLHTLIAFVSLPSAVIYMPLSPHSLLPPSVHYQPQVGRNVSLWITLTYALPHSSVTLEMFPVLLYLCRLFYHRCYSLPQFSLPFYLFLYSWLLNARQTS